MTTILLTTVCRPFGGAGEGDSVAAELFHAQVTRAQGIFSLRQVIRCWGLDYIAHNLQALCTVLHYPSERELVRELKSRTYHYVGINFVVPTFHKLRRVSELVRRHSPETRIILGGYGTVLPDELLLSHGDFICREEGIAFMRRLLGEKPDAPLRHPYCPIPLPCGPGWPTSPAGSAAPMAAISAPRRTFSNEPISRLSRPAGNCTACCWKMNDRHRIAAKR
jgi:hypothetical protein